MDLSMLNARDSLSQTNWHVRELERNFRTFVGEVFIFLSDHFELRTGTLTNPRFFKEEMGRAIITIGYVFRRRLRTYFQKACVNLSDINEFKKLAGHFQLIRDECYFFRIMTRLSHVFELYMYCFKMGHNHIETAMSIAATNGSIIFLETSGGLSRLNQTASFIAEVGKMIDAVIRQEKPQTSGLQNFTQAVESLENSNWDSLSDTEQAYYTLFKRSSVHKFGDGSKLDPRLSKVFYNMICQHILRVYTMNKKHLSVLRDSANMNLDIENEKRAIDELFNVLLSIMLGDVEEVYSDPSITTHLATLFANFRHLTDLVSAKLEQEEVNPEPSCKRPNLQFDRNINSSNKYFIVAEGEMHKLLHPDPFDEVPTQKRPYNDPELKSTWKVLGSNIEAKNYFQMNDGRYVVYMPDCKFEDDTTVVIVPTTLVAHSATVDRQMGVNPES